MIRQWDDEPTILSKTNNQNNRYDDRYDDDMIATRNVVNPIGSRFSSALEFYRRRVPRKLVVFLLTGLSTLFALLSVGDCSFMTSSTFSYSNDSRDAKIGLFSQAVYDLDGDRLGCVKYNSMSKARFDGSFRASRAFAVLTALILTTTFTVLSFVLLLLPFRNNNNSDAVVGVATTTTTRTIWSACQYSLMASTVTQMFTFFALGSDFACNGGGGQGKCQLTGVGILACMNVVLLAGLSIVAYLEPAPTEPWLLWWDEYYQQRFRNESLTRINPQVSQFLTDQKRMRENADRNQTTAQGYQQQRPNSFTAAGGGDNENLTASAAWRKHDHPLSHPSQQPPRYNGEDEDDDDNDPEVEAERQQQATSAREEGPPSITIVYPGQEIGDEEEEHPPPESEYGDDNFNNLATVAGFRILLAFLFTFCWTVCIAGVERCSFILVGPVGGSLADFSGVGFFKRAVYSDGEVVGCIEYPDETKSEFDRVFLASRVFASVAALLMTVVWLLNAAQLFVNTAKEEMWFVIRVLLPSATIFQLLVFFVYRTETCVYTDSIECVPGQLGIWVILNVILMVALSVLVLTIPPPPHPLLVRNQVLGHENRMRPPRRMTKRRGRQSSHVEEGGVVVVDANGIVFSQPHPTKQYDTDEDDWTAKDSMYGGGGADKYHTPQEELNAANTEQFVRVVDPNASRSPAPPPPSTFVDEPASMISCTVEYNGKEKKIIKTLTHPDGSKTITTTIEEISDDSNDETSNVLEDIDLEGESSSSNDDGSDDDDSDSVILETDSSVVIGDDTYSDDDDDEVRII